MVSKIVTINGKEFLIAEKKNKELQKLVETYSKEISAVEIKGFDAASILSAVLGFISCKLIEIIPELKQEDLDEAYPSEIDNAVEVFLNLNFPLARRFGSPVMTLLQLASQVKTK